MVKGGRVNGKRMIKGEEDEYISPISVAAYFFVLIPPCFLSSKAPACRRSRIEHD